MQRHDGIILHTFCVIYTLVSWTCIVTHILGFSTHMQQIFYPIMATEWYYFYKCFKSITPIYLGTSVSLVGQRELSLHSDIVSIKATLTVITINHFRWNREWKEGFIKWNIITSCKSFVFFVSLSVHIFPFFTILFVCSLTFLSLPLFWDYSLDTMYRVQIQFDNRLTCHLQVSLSCSHGLLK
jgi:hypothetical protein